MLHLLKNFFSIGKKVLIVFITFFLIINLFLYFISEDKSTQTYDPIKDNREKIYKVINDPELNNDKEGKMTIAVYRGITCSWIGEACTDNPDDGDKNFNKSLFGSISSLMAMTYTNPPASGVYWAKSGLENAGFISRSYAAEGIGFAGIKPLMNIWKIFRDVAYMLLVLVVVAIGFMIMFRMKLNPQTVMTAENALPKIVISLIIITFSFAIAGFMIDLMYVAISTVISLLSNKDTFFRAADYNAKFLTGGPDQILPSVFPAGFDTLLMVGNSLINIMPTVVNLFVRFLSGIGALVFTYHTMKIIQNVIEMFNGIGATIVGTGTNTANIPGGIISLIIIPLIFGAAFLILPQLIIAIFFIFTLLFLFFRIFFLLLKAYIQILILIVFSPIILLGTAIPGKSTLGYWFKNLIAEILTFPLVITILLFGTVIMKELAAPGKLWTPPMLYTLDPNAFTVLVGMGILLIIPDFNKLMKELLGVKGMPIGLNVGAFFGGIGGPAGGAMGIMQQYTSFAYFAGTPIAKKISERFKGFGDIFGGGIKHPPKPGG